MSRSDDTRTPQRVQRLTASGPQDIPPGSVLIICATPGFRRAGLTHERVKLWPRHELSDEQLDALKGESELTIIEVC